jgi:hypothetical protein
MVPREIAAWALANLACPVCGTGPGTVCPPGAREPWQAVCMARFGLAAVAARRRERAAGCQVCRSAGGEVVRVRRAGQREWRRVRLCPRCTAAARADERVEVAVLALVA